MLHATVRCKNPNSPIIFTKEQYEDGLLQKFDEQNNSNWSSEFQNAEWHRWKEVEDMFDYEEECCGARAFVLDGIYECVCEAINEGTDEE